MVCSVWGLVAFVVGRLRGLLALPLPKMMFWASLKVFFSTGLKQILDNLSQKKRNLEPMK